MALVHADRESAVAAATRGARERAAIYRVTQCTVAAPEGQARHKVVFAVDSATRWGQILPPGENHLIFRYM